MILSDSENNDVTHIIFKAYKKTNKISFIIFFSIYKNDK